MRDTLFSWPAIVTSALILLLSGCGPEKTIVERQLISHFLDETFLEGSGGIGSVSFSPDGRTIVAGDAVGQITFWNADSGAHLRTTRPNGYSDITAIKFSKTGERVLIGSLSGSLTWLDAHTGRELLSHGDSGGYLSDLALTPDEKRVMFTRRSSLFTLDADFAASERILGAQNFATSAGDVRLDISGDGKTLAYGDGLGIIRVWDLTTQKQIKEMERQLKSRSIRDVAFDISGNTFAVAGYGGIEVYDAKSFERVASMELKQTIDCIAFNPKGNQVASGSRDAKVRIWNLDDGSMVKTLASSPHYAKGGRGGEIWCLSWRADGERLVAGTRIRTEVWDVKRDKLVLTLGE